MKLDNRLLQIAKLVQPNSIVVDIGCDHGFLSIYLVSNGITKFAYASDVNQFPLKSAQSNIKKYHLEKQIKTVLSDGLSEFEKIDFNTLVIAGMGGSLIVEILSNHLELVKDKHLILQPNVNDAGLRKFLVENNLKIINDYIVKENNIFYDIIEVDNKKDSDILNHDWSILDYIIGYYNLKRDDELVRIKIVKTIGKYHKLLCKIPISNPKYANVEKIFKELMVKNDELTKNNTDN